MPLFDRELNELADRFGRSNLAIWLHTAAPTQGSPTNGRTTVGGGGFASGVTLLATGISNAASGDITNNADINFGQATAGRGDGGCGGAPCGARMLWPSGRCRAP